MQTTQGARAKKKAEVGKKKGPHGESNPGPLAPKASIIPLDHAATLNGVVWTTAQA